MALEYLIINPTMRSTFVCTAMTTEEECLGRYFLHFHTHFRPKCNPQTILGMSRHVTLHRYEVPELSPRIAPKPKNPYLSDYWPCPVKQYWQHNVREPIVHRMAYIKRQQGLG